MAKKTFIKIFSVLLSVIMLLCIGITALSIGFSYTNNNATIVYAEGLGNKGQGRNYTQNLEDININLDKINKKLESPSRFKQIAKDLKKSKEASSLVTDTTNIIVSVIKNSGDLNKNSYLDIVNTIVGLGCVFIPGGNIISDVVGGILGAFKDSGPSDVDILKEELNKLQQHLDEQFVIVNEGIQDVRDDISDLSEEIDESLHEVVEQLASVIEASEAGQNVRNFMFSGEGNFDYSLFKNYLEGLSDNSNNLASSAYYDKLVGAIQSKADEYVIEKNINDLYSAIKAQNNERISYIDKFRQYVMPKEDNINSIQKDYFEFLLSNREALEEQGKSVEWEAILFTYDIYKTLLMAERHLLVCDNYFLNQIYLNSSELSDYSFYLFENPNGQTTYVEYKDLKNEIEYLTNEENIQDVAIQMLKDIIYILNMENSYTLDVGSEELFYITNDDNETFGNVMSGQTIYMNRLGDEILELFDIDSQKFTYRWSTGEENTGTIVVPSGILELSVQLLYNGKSIYSAPIKFKVNGSDFSGGDGTEEKPYLISDASQFSKIIAGKNGKNVHYKLIKDIDFKGATISSIGDESNAFAGTLDGNGYALKNFTINNSSKHVGLFAKISENGCINNLTFDNIKISTEIKDKGVGEYCVGLFAGQNEGKIYNCHVINSKLYVKINETSAKDKKGNVVSFVGGLVGISNGANSSIIACSLVGSSVECDSYRTIDAGDVEDKDKRNIVYLGGIVGKANYTTIQNCIVEGNSSLKGYAKTTDEETKKHNKHQYVECYVAGAIGIDGGRSSDSISNISKIYVSNSVTKEARVTSNMPSYDEEFASSNSEVITNVEMVNLFEWKEKVPNSLRNEISMQTVNNRYVYINYSYMGEIVGELNLNQNQIYNYGEQFLKQEGVLTFSSANSDFVLQNYDILAYYGLETLKTDKIDGEIKTVKVLINATLIEKANPQNQRTGNYIVEIPIFVNKIKPIELRIDTLPKTYYDVPGEVALEGGKYVLVYEDGTEKEVKPQIISGDAYSCGKKEIVLSCEEVTASYRIEVYCEHNYIEEQVSSTCTMHGYTEYTCSICGARYEDNYLEKLEHDIIVKDSVEPTCTTEGMKGAQYCTSCKEIIVDNAVVEMLPHNYTHLDSKSHYCLDCGVAEKQDHRYTTVENEESLIYTCICGYTQIIDVKEDDKGIRQVSRVIVSESYALVGSRNLVVVYVKMFNNPGITGISFRIDYDKRLEYVSCENGEVLASAREFQVYDKTKGVIGLVGADTDPSYANGNLLKLTFKIPKNAELLEKFDISIACSSNQFTNEYAESINILTMPGKITVVENLPGDVNCDGVVDILDTVLISKYVAFNNAINAGDQAAKVQLKEFIGNVNFSEFYADVNIDGEITLNDLVLILQYLVGKNTTELVSNDYEIILNSNDGKTEFDTINVKFKNSDGSFGTYPELPILERDGYRFDGWFTSFDVNDLSSFVKTGDTIEFRYDFLRQVLYAHWTAMYKVEYEINAPTNSIVSGVMDDSYFEFGTVYNLPQNQFEVLGYKFKGWALNPSGPVKYLDGEIIEEPTEIGKSITLYAVWEANEYTIKFNNNKPGNASSEITATMDNLNCVYDVAFTLPQVEYKLTGWTFEGWSTSATGSVVYSDCQELNNLTTEDGKVITLYAVWEANEYTIKFVSVKPSTATSEMKGAMEDVTVEYEEAISLVNKFELEGWTFLGWVTTANGAHIYGDTDVVKNLSATNGDVITLYAKWATGFYTVKYDSNAPECGCTVNGSMLDSRFAIDTVQILKDNKYSIDGHRFVGWSTTPDGNVQYENMEEVMSLTHVDNGSVTLYAVWEANEYIVSYYGNGADSGHMESTTHTYHVAQALRQNGFTRIGYTFVGWAEENPNNAVKYINKASVKNLSSIDNGNVELYAKWQVNSYNLIYDLAGGSGTFNTQIYNYRSTIGNKPSSIPTREGYTFIDWISSDATITWGSKMPAKNITMTAKWAPIVYYNSWDYVHNEKIDASSERTIDRIDISSIQEFLNSGYKITFSLSLYMREEDAGYQEFYLCDASGTHLAGESAYEYGGSGKAYQTYEWRYFDWTIDGNKCTTTMLLRYGAHGDGGDDWYRSQANVVVKVYKV